MLEHSLFFITF